MQTEIFTWKPARKLLNLAAANNKCSSFPGFHKDHTIRPIALRRGNERNKLEGPPDIQLSYGLRGGEIKLPPDLLFAAGKNRPEPGRAEADFLRDSKNIFKVAGQRRRYREGSKLILCFLNQPPDGNSLLTV